MTKIDKSAEESFVETEDEGKQYTTTTTNDEKEQSSSVDENILCYENLTTTNTSMETSEDEEYEDKKRRRRRMVMIPLAALGIIAAISTIGIIIAMFTSKHSSTNESNIAQELTTKSNHQTTKVPSTILPSITPTNSPSITPTNAPSLLPTIFPSTPPTIQPTQMPSVKPSNEQSLSPSVTISSSPSQQVTANPSNTPTHSPTNKPTRNPTPSPSSNPVNSDRTSSSALDSDTIFYAIGDVPYTDDQAVKLEKQIINLAPDAEFLIHVGDIRKAGDDVPCTRSEYSSVASILSLSHAPVFIILGDNDWNDCPNRATGLSYWKDEFLHFESKYWDHDFNIINQPDREENFAFEHKGTLFIGLNLVGGTYHSSSEWTNRLTEQVEWTIELIKDYVASDSSSERRVVIFGHCDPTYRHNKFFIPLRNYIRNFLQNEIPILYVNGDRHEYLSEPNFFNQPSFYRVMVEGKAVDPPMKVTVHGESELTNPVSIFEVDRGL